MPNSDWGSSGSSVSATPSITDIVAGSGSLGYVPVNKAGDTGIGNLSMAALTATVVNVTGAWAGINLAGKAFAFSDSSSTYFYSPGSGGFIFRNNPDTTSIATLSNTGVLTATRLALLTGLVIQSGSEGVLTTTSPIIRANDNGNGNLIISAHGVGAVYLNYDKGTGGTKFCNGASGIVAQVNSDGSASFLASVVVDRSAVSIQQHISFSTGTSYDMRVGRPASSDDLCIWSWNGATQTELVRVTPAGRLSATSAQIATQRLGLGTYNADDATTFQTRSTRGCHFGREYNSGTGPGGGAVWNYLQLPEVNDGVNYGQGILAMSTDGRAYFGYGPVASTPTWTKFLTMNNMGTDAASFQAAVASATAPLVGTVAQRTAYTPTPGTTPYWYATDETAPDGMLGTLRQWTGSAWGSAQNAQTVVGRVVAGVISAGAVGAQAIAANAITAAKLETTMAITSVIQSSNYAAGTSSATATGFKLSGSTWTATALGGSTYSVNMEIGSQALIAGQPAVNMNFGRLYRGGGLSLGPGTYSLDTYLPSIPSGGYDIAFVEITICGGGAGGGGSNGGGSGACLTIVLQMSSVTRGVQIIVGAAGGSGANGGDSSIGGTKWVAGGGRTNGTGGAISCTDANGTWTLAGGAVAVFNSSVGGNGQTISGGSTGGSSVYEGAGSIAYGCTGAGAGVSSATWHSGTCPGHYWTNTGAPSAMGVGNGSSSAAGYGYGGPLNTAGGPGVVFIRW